ncbi:hypothetical protein SCALM49S_02199 [Streptomyces californicus]
MLPAVLVVPLVLAPRRLAVSRVRLVLAAAVVRLVLAAAFRVAAVRVPLVLAARDARALRPMAGALPLALVRAGLLELLGRLRGLRLGGRRQHPVVIAVRVSRRARRRGRRRLLLLRGSEGRGLLRFERRRGRRGRLFTRFER